MGTRISATEAVRKFREVLNAVEATREVFEIERHGKLVAQIGPAQPAAPPSITWGEAVRLLLEGPQPDPAFADDLAAIRLSQGALPADPWARS